MNGTPRLRSAFPSTPQSTKNNDAHNASTTAFSAASSSIPSLPISGGDGDAPLIPANVLDAPSQRFYIAFFYLGLTVWRFYDYFTLLSDETESLWLFMKWVGIDSAVLYGLPGLRVPWLQWSSSTTTLLVVCHGILNAILMFRIPVSTPLKQESLDALLIPTRFHFKLGSLLSPASCMIASLPYQKEV